MDYSTDPDIKKFMEDLKEDVSEEKYANYEQSIPKAVKTRDEFFEVAGIDKSIISEIEEVVLRDHTTEEICALIAPQLRKALSVDVDPENAEEGEFKFKTKKDNILDEIGMSDDTTAQLLTLMAKCYSDDKDEDWHQLSHQLLPYVDKFFAPAYQNAKEMGLLPEDQQ